ncbi:MAG: hypothetical protein L3K14_00755 [Thermoplasmata archaeon]|nr:hypothetical protein [Thermoplasmata archaeon]
MCGPQNAYAEHRGSATDSVSGSTSTPLGSRWPTAQQIGLGGFGALVVAAVAFYLWWGLSYGTWLDNGEYAVVITLLLFGLAGLWLFWPETPVGTPPSA